jgi:hypothetical protein
MSDLKETIRERSTVERQAHEHLQKTMETRAEAELMRPAPTVEETARETAAAQRLQEDHLRETMQERSAAAMDG